MSTTPPIPSGGEEPASSDDSGNSPPPPPVADPAELRGELTDDFDGDAYEKIVDFFLVFLRERLKTVRSLTDIADPEVNLSPFLMLALAPAYNIFSPFEVAEYIQMAKFPHGDFTSFGMRLDSGLMSIFGVGKPDEKSDPATKKLFSPIDNDIVVSGKRFLISIKSGPRTINQAHANEMIRTFPEIYKTKKCDIIIGIAYGKPEKVNNKPALVIGETGSYVHCLVGKAFWEFITGVRDGHLKMFRAIREAQRRFAVENSGETFYEQMIAARLELARSFRETFDLTGADETDMWDEIFNRGF